MKRTMVLGRLLPSLTLLFLLLGCGPGPQNSGNNGGALATTTPLSSPSPSPSATPPPTLCQQYGNEPGQLQSELDRMVSNSGVGSQWGKGAFKFHISKAAGGNDLIMAVSGNMGRMRDFLDVIVDSVKPTCLTRVYFVNKTHYKDTGLTFTPDSADFYWFGCDPGYEACDGNCVPNGQCHGKTRDADTISAAKDSAPMAPAK